MTSAQIPDWLEPAASQRQSGEPDWLAPVQSSPAQSLQAPDWLEPAIPSTSEPAPAVDNGYLEGIGKGLARTAAQTGRGILELGSTAGQVFLKDPQIFQPLLPGAGVLAYTPQGGRQVAIDLAESFKNNVVDVGQQQDAALAKSDVANLPIRQGWSEPKWWTENVSEVGGQLLQQVGLSAATGGAGPVMQALSFAAPAAGQVYSQAYEGALREMRAQGVPEERAQALASAEGLVNSVVEFGTEAAMGKMYGNAIAPVKEPAKKFLRQVIAQYAKDISVHGAKEGFQEGVTGGIQDLVTYARQKLAGVKADGLGADWADFLDKRLTEFALGFIPGGAMGAVHQYGATRGEAPQPEAQSPAGQWLADPNLQMGVTPAQQAFQQAGVSVVPTEVAQAIAPQPEPVVAPVEPAPVDTADPFAGIPESVPDAPITPKPVVRGRRLNKAAIERELLDWGQQNGQFDNATDLALSNTLDPDEQAQALQMGDVTTFKGKVPPDLTEALQGRSNLRMMVRSSPTGGNGWDVLSSLGVDGYVKMLEDMQARSDAPRLRRMFDVVRRSPNLYPRASYLARVYENNIEQGEFRNADSELVDPETLPDGSTFTAQGETFRVADDGNGRKIIESPGFWLYAEGMGDVPVDTGSVVVGQPVDVDLEERMAIQGEASLDAQSAAPTDPSQGLYFAPPDFEKRNRIARENNYEPVDVPRVRAAQRMASLIERYKAGEIDQGQYERGMDRIQHDLANARDIKEANKIGVERERGYDIVREKLIRARRTGELSEPMVDLTLWALEQNPALAHDLGISVKTSSEENLSAGNYNPVGRIVTYFKNFGTTTTGLHEIMHHAERMMPADMQQAIRQEWAERVTREMENADPARRDALQDMMEYFSSRQGNPEQLARIERHFRDGLLTKADYRLANPSEFWTEHASELMGRRRDAQGSIWSRIYNWLKELVQRVRGAAGLRSDAPVLKALGHVLDPKANTGEFQSEKMIAPKGKSFSENPVDPSQGAPQTKAQIDALHAELEKRAKAGDKNAEMEARQLVNRAAKEAGYSPMNDQRMSHQAPDRENTNLLRIKESGLVPDDYWTKPSWYQNMPEEWESFGIVSSALNRQETYTKEGTNKTARIVVYRAVPKNIKEDKVRNGDWVTPSKSYAVMEGKNIPGGYRIISHGANLSDLWWDGNSIAELGFDNGKEYAYRNTKNNRKLMDPFTYDGESLIPLSKRFQSRNPLEYFDINPDRLKERNAKAQAEPEGKQTIGRPDLANPAETPQQRRVVNAVDSLREEDGKPTPQTHKEWEDAADAKYAANPEAVYQTVINTAKSEGVLSPVDTKAASKVISTETQNLLNNPDANTYKRAYEVTNAYRETGTAAGRSLGARQDQYLTPAQRYRQFLSEAIVKPSEGAEKKIKAKKREIENFEADGDKEGADRAKRQLDQLYKAEAMKLQKLKKKLLSIGFDLDGTMDILDFLKDADITDDLKARVARGVREIQASKGTWGRLQEYWVNSILSGPKTQIVNFVGNAASGTWEFTVQRAAEAFINEIADRSGALKERTFQPGSKLTSRKTTDLGARFGEFPYLAKALIPGLQRASQNFIKSWKTNLPVLAEQVGIKGASHEAGLSLGQDGPQAQIPGRLGEVVRVPTRLLTATDELFKSLYATMDAQAIAYRVARAEGLQGDAMAKRIAGLVDDLESPAWHAAFDKAKDLTFQQDLGKVGRAVTVARDALGPVGTFILPFVRTPANIFKTGLRKSPLGIVPLAYQVFERARTGAWNDGYTRQKLTRDVAEQVLAWSATIALLGAAGLGGDGDEPLITGTGEPGSNPGGRDLQQRTYPPMSIKLGGKWYSYARVEPMATTLASIMDLLNSYKRAKRGDDAGKISQDAYNRLRGQVRDKTFLKGIGDIIRATESPGAFFPTWANSFAVSWVPNITRQPQEAFGADLNERRAWGTGEEFRGRLGRRFLEGAAPSVWLGTPKVDIWGRTITKTGDTPAATDWLWRATTPVDVRKTMDAKDPATKYDRLILNYINQNPDQEIKGLRIPDPTFRLGREDVTLTDAEYQQFLELAGKKTIELLERVPMNVDKPGQREKMILERTIEAARTWARVQVGQARKRAG